MHEWKVKKGNTSIQDFEIFQKDGETLVANLAAVTAIEFNVCLTKAGAAVITLTKNNGIVVNSPLTGWARLTLTPAETAITAQDYFMGLQLTWSAGLVYDCVLFVDGVETDKFIIEPDIVNL